MTAPRWSELTEEERADVGDILRDVIRTFEANSLWADAHPMWSRRARGLRTLIGLAKRAAALERCAEVLRICGDMTRSHEQCRTFHASEDAAVLALCRRVGFGAVIDSACRQWALEPLGDIGAFTIGPCRATLAAALAELDQAEGTG